MGELLVVSLSRVECIKRIVEMRQHRDELNPSKGRPDPSAGWLTVLLLCAVLQCFALPAAGLGQEKSPGGTNEEAKDESIAPLNPSDPGPGAAEPSGADDQNIQVDPIDPGVPPVSPNRNRSNGLRKTLQNQPAQDDAEAPVFDPQDVGGGGPTVVTAPTEGDLGQDPASVKPKKAMIPTDPVGLFLAGGHLMPVILLASIVSLWFGLERIFVLRRGRVIPKAFVNRFLQHLEEGKLTPETALRLCEENNSPMAEVFAHGVRKWGKTSVEVEQAIIDGGERQVAQLRTNMRVINGMANIAPMLGLLGTVFGMIISFNELAQGNDTNRSERLANGIGHALITTAAGLTVAILSIMLYMYLSSRIDKLVMEMDDLAQKVVNLISGEALASRPRMAAAKPATNVATTSSPAVTAPTGKPKPVGT